MSQSEQELYEAVQGVYLSWHNNARPMSGFVKELQQHEFVDTCDIYDRIAAIKQQEEK